MHSDQMIHGDGILFVCLSQKGMMITTDGMHNAKYAS
jgi:hypothetical protein